MQKSACGVTKKTWMNFRQITIKGEIKMGVNINMVSVIPKIVCGDSADDDIQKFIVEELLKIQRKKKKNQQLCKTCNKYIARSEYIQRNVRIQLSAISKTPSLGINHEDGGEHYLLPVDNHLRVYFFLCSVEPAVFKLVKVVLIM